MTVMEGGSIERVQTCTRAAPKSNQLVEITQLFVPATEVHKIKVK